MIVIVIELTSSRIYLGNVFWKCLLIMKMYYLHAGFSLKHFTLLLHLGTSRGIRVKMQTSPHITMNIPKLTNYHEISEISTPRKKYPNYGFTDRLSFVSLSRKPCFQLRFNFPLPKMSSTFSSKRFPFMRTF